jgi:hypothetical protein
MGGGIFELSAPWKQPPVFVGIYDTGWLMVVYQHYSREQPNGAVNNGRYNSRYTPDWLFTCLD